MTNYKNQPRKAHKRVILRTLLIVGILVLALTVLAALELTNITHLLHTQKVPNVISVQPTSRPAAVRSTEGDDLTSSDKTANTSSHASTTTESQKSIGASSTPSSAPLALVTPYGSFVSNHIPESGGSNSHEQSTCNTTAGASCYIQFTNTDSKITTHLPTKTADTNGSVIWDWDIHSDAHLTTGHWSITAFASLNGDTKSASDSQDLEIQ